MVTRQVVRAVTAAVGTCALGAFITWCFGVDERGFGMGCGALWTVFFAGIAAGIAGACL